MSRRELREHIFRLLFRTEFHSEAEMTEQEDFYLEDLGEMSDDDRIYIQGKVDAIREKKSDLDGQIDCVADKWKTGRMTKVDLTVIRLARSCMMKKYLRGWPLTKLWNWQKDTGQISRLPL